MTIRTISPATALRRARAYITAYTQGDSVIIRDERTCWERPAVPGSSLRAALAAARRDEAEHIVQERAHLVRRHECHAGARDVASRAGACALAARRQP